MFVIDKVFRRFFSDLCKKVRPEVNNTTEHVDFINSNCVYTIDGVTNEMIAIDLTVPRKT